MLQIQQVYKTLPWNAYLLHPIQTLQNLKQYILSALRHTWIYTWISVAQETEQMTTLSGLTSSTHSAANITANNSIV
jgi:hypothetical protein